MTIKRVITAGCSFSDVTFKISWPWVLQSRYPNLSFRHTGMMCQGQDLIQKKICLAVSEELKNYKPEELAVIVMWSGTERKAFYVDNPYFIKKRVLEWHKNSITWLFQFTNLYGKVDTKFQKQATNSRATLYNSNNGWYHSNYLDNDIEFIKKYFSTMDTIIGHAINSLENIIMCQNFCKVNNIKMYQTFYRDYVFSDLEKHKSNSNLSYLYNMLDFDSIITTKGMYEHLRPFEGTQNNNSRGGIFRHFFDMTIKDETMKYFCPDNFHPNHVGAAKWCDEVLVPGLKSKGFLDKENNDE